ncbi:sugar O-acyltransferase (sialic acid O-acetyltransferase NeuD family) [Variovorax boronicumulans]|uniref:NeuD/PglB/VioB family sugar acetyltransferase n=1 Tax=Variovorax boronicumulans TaxID=436515 RepID=UPI0024732604|nr:NeuD/PglB/VioB family sugar acetyltransferase [Variovorax boronicumulans]MDH6167550.1 sugar O-acyltransferase (sialic acid O-acetyltransferase NeuD family) [Variovorax boronicumulans]
MTLLIYGAGGLGREVLSALQACGEHVAGFVVDPGFPVADIRGLQVRAERLETFSDPGVRLVLAVGDGRARQRAALSIGTAVECVAVRHPAAVIGSGVSVGAGALIIGLCSITTDVSIGSHTLINPGSTIAHDCVLGDFVNLGPSCSLAGRVTVQEGANLGVGVSVAPGVVIGAWSTVGAGAVVIRDVEPGSTVVGVPARPIQRRGGTAASVPPPV